MISVRQRLLVAEGPDDGKRIASTRVQQLKGVEGLTFVDLFAIWNGVVEALETYDVKIINPDHALEGALSIR